MPNRKERQGYVGVPVGQGAPNKILHHAVVLVLSGAVVCMQIHIPLPKAVVVKKVVDAAYYSIGTFATVSCLIGQEIDLPR